MAGKREVSHQEEKDWSEHLSIFQSLQKHPGYELLMRWVDERTRGTFVGLMSEKDPTQLAKDVGSVSAFKEVRVRVDSEINATVKLLSGAVEE